MSSTATKPQVMEVITLQDITAQILTNAEVLFPNEKELKVVSGKAQSGLVYHTSLVGRDMKSASAHKEWKIVLNGPGGKSRRDSMMGLLEETEKRVAKQVLKK